MINFEVTLREKLINKSHIPVVIKIKPGTLLRVNKNE